MKIENKELLIKDLKDIYEKLDKSLPQETESDLEYEVAEAMNMLLEIIGVLEKKG